MTAAGVLHKILAQEDSKVPVGQLLAVIGAEDEDVSSLIGRSLPSPMALAASVTAAAPLSAVTPKLRGNHPPGSYHA